MASFSHLGVTPAKKDKSLEKKQGTLFLFHDATLCCARPHRFEDCCELKFIVVEG